MEQVTDIIKNYVILSSTILGLIFYLVQFFFEKKIGGHFQKSLDNNQSILNRTEELSKQYMEFNISIDEDLRNKRLPVYKTLWQKMEILPQYPVNEDLTYIELVDLCKKFKIWYFNEGGMFLSEESRKEYGKVQEQLIKCSSNNQEGIVSKEDYENIRESCSELRTQLTIDLNSRRNSKVIENLKNEPNTA